MLLVPELQAAQCLRTSRPRPINTSKPACAAQPTPGEADRHRAVESQVSLVYQFLTGEQDPGEPRLNKMFKFLWRRPFPFFTSPFLNLISLKALELAFHRKGLLNPEQFFATKQFSGRFLHRTRRLAALLVSVPVVLLIFGLAIAVVRYPNNAWARVVVLLLMSAFGVEALASVLGLRDYLRTRTTAFLRQELGYLPPPRLRSSP